MKFKGKERGFSELQRIGIYLFILVLCMSAAAVVEIGQRRVAKDLDLVDPKKKKAIPLSVVWQIPQYIFIGIAGIFTYIGQSEFFYEQFSDAIRSLCNALSFLTLSLGYYLGFFLLTIVTYFTAKDGKGIWIPDNLNEGHLDYFFWLLAVLNFLNMLL
ncbi:Proton-dependent oligopeptide transporter family [Trema orientale]|uniref:Proton-dependent oligopeptide transporter family n=1 Tax=Trema orientale TaxID=63057 RepID=A0A2P5BZ90_TREOI|nr:Proton-dependent oligopeptide transporter family [Trema orientale]